MKELTNLLMGIVVLGIGFHYIYQNWDKVSVVSTVNQKSYKVRKMPDQQQAADKLATLSQSLSRLVDHVYQTYPTKDGITQLNNQFKPDNLFENTPGGQYTAYSVNKGEQLALCLRNATTDEFVPDNLLMFVAIHEVAHIMTTEVGHTPLFWDNMKILLQEAITLGLYIYEDYSQNPQMYCGQEINSTPLNKQD